MIVAAAAGVVVIVSIGIAVGVTVGILMLVMVLVYQRRSVLVISPCPHTAIVICSHQREDDARSDANIYYRTLIAGHL